MEDLDLNIDNYNLNDIINLFKISNNLEEHEIKEAKKIVLRMHPDKSGLNPKYFLFFSKAYKLIDGVSRFKQNSKQNTDHYIPFENKEQNEIIKKTLESPSIKQNFNKWFNELFENTRIQDEYTKTGYQEWLKSNEDIEDYMSLNKSDQKKQLEERRKRITTIIKQEDIKEISTNNSGSSLLRYKPENYSSEIFSSLAFEDIKKAHEESIIPINQDEISNIKRRSLAQLERDRNMKIEMPSLDQAKEILQNRNNINNKESMNRAYTLLKEEEIINKANETCLRSLRQLR